MYNEIIVNSTKRNSFTKHMVGLGNYHKTIFIFINSNSEKSTEVLISMLFSAFIDNLNSFQIPIFS
jgi:hypothetical protein